MRFASARRLALASLFSLAVLPADAADPGEVNVYSYRQPSLIERCSIGSRKRPASKSMSSSLRRA